MVDNWYSIGLKVVGGEMGGGAKQKEVMAWLGRWCNWREVGGVSGWPNRQCVVPLMSVHGT